jgi:hypothetical protein
VKSRSRIKRLRQQFNDAVNGVLRSSSIATSGKKTLGSKNPILHTKTNEEMSRRLKPLDDYMHTNKFVMNNIENLHPRTIKAIFKKSNSKRRPKALPKRAPTKTTPVDPYDAAVIERLLVSGTSIEKIMERFPEHTRRQILDVGRYFKKARSEKFDPDVLDFLNRIKGRRLSHWF